VADSKPGDVAYCHYSGHGGKLRDDNNDEEDGYDETLVPLDFKNAGQIRDDDLLDTLVVRMPKGVFVTAVMDCCHSGTVFDLPYNFKADGQQQSMTQNDNFDFGPFIKILSQIMSNPKIIQQASQVASSFGCCNVS
jgi:hypothetical protein